MTASSLPIVIIGAGPIGHAAADQLLARGLEPLALEARPEIGHAVRAWGHVRMFSPRRYNIDAAARVLLEAEGWVAREADAYPTGDNLVHRYLAPLAAISSMHQYIRRGRLVVGVARRDFGRLHDSEARDAARFVLHFKTCCGIQAIEARAGIGCSGTCEPAK